MACNRIDPVHNKPVCGWPVLGDCPIDDWHVGWLQDLCTRFSGVARKGLSHLVLSALVDAAGAGPDCVGGGCSYFLPGSGWFVGYVTDVMWL